MARLLTFIIVVFSLVQDSNSQSWFQLNSGTIKNLGAVFFLDENIGWSVGQSGIVLKTTNGGDLWSQNIIPDVYWLADVFFTNEYTGWAVQSYPEGRIYKTTDGGNNWFLQRVITFPGYIAIQFYNINLGWAVNYFYANNEIVKTTDGGNSWIPTSIQSGYYDEFQNIKFVNEFTGYVVCSTGEILKSTDSGDTWNFKSSVAAWLYSVDFVNPDTGWVVGNYGKIYKTTDGANTWVSQNTPTTSPLYDIKFINENLGWAVGYGVILKTIDGGTNWIWSFGGFAHKSLCFINQNTGWVVGASGKIFKTTDGGALPVELTSFGFKLSNNKVNLSWTTTTELNNHGFEIERSIDKISWRTIGFKEGKGTTSEPQQYSYSDNILDLTTSKIYYRLKQVDFNGSFEYSDILEVLIAPSKFSLEQNYPNPFNPNTNIQFAISSLQFVTLKVYDVLGNEVATLVNQEKPAGNYEVEFDASHLSSGVYYYQLWTGEFVETKKMILLR
jgi:photosystem II stability/assembly factor-like uncharacterized protein